MRRSNRKWNRSGLVIVSVGHAGQNSLVENAEEFELNCLAPIGLDVSGLELCGFVGAAFG
jgi:hypothetical protein